MCRVMRVQRSGYYAWLKQPVSAQGREDLRLLGLIRSFYAESGGLYGSPRIYKDLREFGERCGENRVARLMRQDGIRAQRGSSGHSTRQDLRPSSHQTGYSRHSASSSLTGSG